MPTHHGLRGQTKSQTPGVSPVQLTFSASAPAITPTEKADAVTKRLGFDPREGISLRAAVRELRMGSGLAATDREALARINASKYVKKPLDEGDVYLHKIEAASNRFVPDRYCFIGASTLQNIVAAAEQGFAIMTRHATGGWSGDGENPYGRTYAGQFEQQGDLARALVQFYMLRDHRPNGTTAPSTDDLDKGLNGGTLFDFSVGLALTGSESIVCDVCTRELYDAECGHYPGTQIAMSPEDIARQKARGIPDGRASYTMEGWGCSEASIVYDGAIPNAGTAYAKAAPAAAKPAEVPPPTVTETPAAELATEQPAAAEPLTEEPMYSKELKLSLGLKEDATDAQVDARLAALKNAEAENATLKTSAETDKARADKAEAEAFKTAYAGKLADDVIADLTGLPSAQRGPLAAKLAAQTKQETVVPPIDGLANTAAAAAPAVKQLSNWTDRDEAWRQGLGVVDSPEEVHRLLSMSPIAALNKCLGTRLGETPYSTAAVKSRFAVFGITQAPVTQMAAGAK